MRVRDADVLRNYVTQTDIGYARAGRFAECSRQFIWQLCNGEKATCSDEVGERLEELLQVLPGTLFVREGLRTARRNSVRQATTRAGAAA
jgi:hypothetical protein